MLRDSEVMAVLRRLGDEAWNMGSLMEAEGFRGKYVEAWKTMSTELHGLAMQMAKKLNPKCGEVTCPDESTHSLVWPGHGKMVYCAKHKEKALAVADCLGLTQASLCVEVL